MSKPTAKEKEKELTVDDVHATILADAEFLANQRAFLELDLSGAGGQIFRADPVQTQRGGLTLSVDELTERTLGEDETKLNYIYEIGAWALEEAIFRNQEIWAAAIFSEAHQGRNYFDRFLLPGEQTRLF